MCSARPAWSASGSSRCSRSTRGSRSPRSRRARSRRASRTPTRSPGAGRCRRRPCRAAAASSRSATRRTSRAIASQVDFVFCAVDMAKDETAKLEEATRAPRRRSSRTTRAHRWTPDVPMMIPEINARPRGGDRGAAQAPRHQARVHRGEAELLDPELRAGDPSAARVRAARKIAVCTYQAISRRRQDVRDAGPRWSTTSIPFIKGEEEKREQEPLKIWGTVDGGKIVDGDGAGDHRAVHPRAGERRPHGRGVRRVREEADAGADPLGVAASSRGKPQQLALPSAPTPFLHYFEDDDRPQTRLDRDARQRARRSTIGRLARRSRSSTGDSSRCRTTRCAARRAAPC